MTLPSPVLGYPHLLFAAPTVPCCYNLLLLDNTCHGQPKLAQTVPGCPKMTLAALTRTRLLQPVLGCTTHLPLANSNLLFTAPTCPLLPQPVHDCPNLFFTALCCPNMSFAAPTCTWLLQSVLTSTNLSLLHPTTYSCLPEAILGCTNLALGAKTCFGSLN